MLAQTARPLVTRLDQAEFIWKYLTGFENLIGMNVHCHCISWLHFLIFVTSITAPQDAHKRLVLQVYLGLNLSMAIYGSNTIEFSAIWR